MAKAIRTGAVVVLVEGYITTFERPDLRNVIHEIVDSRLQGGEYTFTIAPVAPWGVDYSRAREVCADDVCPIAA